MIKLPSLANQFVWNGNWLRYSIWTLSNFSFHSSYQWVSIILRHDKGAQEGSSESLFSIRLNCNADMVVYYLMNVDNGK